MTQRFSLRLFRANFLGTRISLDLVSRFLWGKLKTLFNKFGFFQEFSRFMIKQKILNNNSPNQVKLTKALFTSKTKPAPKASAQTRWKENQPEAKIIEKQTRLNEKHKPRLWQMHFLYSWPSASVWILWTCIFLAFLHINNLPISVHCQLKTFISTQIENYIKIFAQRLAFNFLLNLWKSFIRLWLCLSKGDDQKLCFWLILFFCNLYMI